MKIQPLRLKLREATGSAILEAAEAVVAAEGFSNASLQAIAERAGIAVGTIYNYFDDKNELIEALRKRRREELFEAIDDAAKKHAKDPFAAQLEAFVGAVFAYFDGRRAYLRIALESEPFRSQIVKSADGSKHPAMRQLQERAERIVRLGVREKKLREESVDILAAVLVAIVRGVLIVRSQSELPFSPETARVVGIFMGGAAK